MLDVVLIGSPDCDCWQMTHATDSWETYSFQTFFSSHYCSTRETPKTSRTPKHATFPLLVRHSFPYLWTGVETEQRLTAGSYQSVRETGADLWPAMCNIIKCCWSFIWADRGQSRQPVHGCCYQYHLCLCNQIVLSCFRWEILHCLPKCYSTNLLRACRRHLYRPWLGWLKEDMNIFSTKARLTLSAEKIKRAVLVLGFFISKFQFQIKNDFDWSFSRWIGDVSDFPCKAVQS